MTDRQSVLPITPEVAGVLLGLRYDHAIAHLPDETLSRREYSHVDKVMEALGGAWKRELKGYVFPTDAQPIIRAALHTGYVLEYKETREHFWTPGWLAGQMAARAALRNQHVLVPCAGIGRLVEAALMFHPRSVLAIESDFELANHLTARFAAPGSLVTVRAVSFLEYVPKEAPTRILITPPFTGRRYVDHVSHAIDILAPGGMLSAIVPLIRADSPQSRVEKELRERFADLNCDCQMLPFNTFEVPGEDMAAAWVRLSKPR